MEELISFQNNLLAQTNDSWFRYLYPNLFTNERLLGIKGLRGVGKTTILLQYLAFTYSEKSKGLYITADHPYFYNNTLFSLAAEWHQYGGKLLLIDEVHKYPNWSRELKLMYDGYPDMQIIFTSSSALDLYRGESDLSRRLQVQKLHGLSFREYLSLAHGLHYAPFTLQEILTGHGTISQSLTESFKPLPLFEQYLREGYFPFTRQINAAQISGRLINIINTVLESDLSYIQDYSASNVAKVKKLLGVIASSAPFEPNISKIAAKLNLGRNTVNLYLNHLNDAHILKLINRPAKGISSLQKPDKIYFENTSFAYALQSTPYIGTLRETFFTNQLSNAGHSVHLAAQGDFMINENMVFEIGGKNKTSSQVKNLDDAYLALDNIEHGFGHKIPLWLFGFLY